MTTGAIFGVSYVIQLSLGAYALVGLPMRGELPTFYENARKGILLFAVLPCAFLSVIIQLLYIGVYWAKVKSVQATAHRAERHLGGAATGSSASGANPFGSTGQQAPPPQRPETNPFGGQGSGDAPSPPSGDNPFA